MEYLSAEDVLATSLERFQRVAGGQAQALCPFHNERNPSFRVNVDSSSSHYLRWECKGCGARGWGKKLLLRLMGSHMEDVVDGLLPKYPAVTSSHLDKHQRDSLLLPEGVLELFRGWQLDGLLRVGFTEETLNLYEVGYDQWKDAWTYPIRDQEGSLVGIYRRMQQGKAKYLPYGHRDFPEGLVDTDYRFHKSDHLYGLNHQMGRTRDVDGPAVLVEGQKACMWVHQELGDRVLAVAGMGVTLSYRQAELLGWLGRDVLVLYDNTPLAKRAARTSAKILRGAGIPTRAICAYSVDLPQPDDLNREQLEKTLWDS